MLDVNFDILRAGVDKRGRGRYNTKMKLKMNFKYEVFP